MIPLLNEIQKRFMVSESSLSVQFDPPETPPPPEFYSPTVFVFWFHVTVTLPVYLCPVKRSLLPVLLLVLFTSIVPGSRSCLLISVRVYLFPNSSFKFQIKVLWLSSSSSGNMMSSSLAFEFKRSGWLICKCWHYL